MKLIIKQGLLTLMFGAVVQFAGAQKLNNLGKIEESRIPTLPEYRIEKINNEYKVLKDSFVFEGNGFYDIPDGFITTLEVFDNNKDYIKHYNSEGKLLVTILSDRIVNVKISEDGSKLAFNNAENIILVDLTGYQIDTLANSYVYEFVQGGQFIYYNPESKSVYFKNQKIDLTPYPNQFLNYKGRMLVITKQSIYELKGSSLNSIYEFRGTFFDAKVIDDELYFVDKEVKRKSESFSLYKTSDFDKIILVDRLDDLNR